MKKCKMLLSFAIALCSVGVLSSGGMEVKKVEAEETATSAKGRYNLVTDVSELNVDSKIIIVASASEFAMSTTQNSKNRSPVSITKSDGYIEIDNEPSNVQQLTLKEGNKQDTFALYTGNGYLYAAHSKENYLKTQSTIDDNASWTITIDNDAKATIKANGANTRNILKYNSSSSLFSCYSSGQAAVSIYQLYSAEGKSFQEVYAENVNVNAQLSFGFTYHKSSGCELNKSIFNNPKAGTYSNETGKSNDVSFTAKNITSKDSAMQLSYDKSSYIYNSDPLKNDLKTIEILWNNNTTTTKARSILIYGSDKVLVSQPEDSSSLIKEVKYDSSNLTSTVEVESSGVRYIYICFSGGAVYIDSIKLSSTNGVDKDRINDVTNMSLNFKTDFDFTGKTQGTDFTEAGMMFVKGSDVSATYSKKTANVLPEGAIKATQTNYGKEFIVRLEDIPVKDWGTKVTVVPYILFEGTYYFGTAGVTSVIETAAAYASSDATITLSDESVVNVRDVAAAIEGYYNSNNNLGE